MHTGTVPALRWCAYCCPAFNNRYWTENDGGTNSKHAWPDDGVTRVPYFVYEDADLYRLELEQMFRGPVWNYLGLEIEIPSPSAPVPKAARLSIVAVVTSTRSSRRAARCCSASAP